MPTKPPRNAEPTPQPETPDAAAPDIPADSEPPTGLLDPGVYEYTHVNECVYPHVPLTARAAHPGRPARPASDGDSGDPGEPAVIATVFHWAFGAPDDGRWAPTRKKPNQAADNEPAPSSEE